MDSPTQSLLVRRKLGDLRTPGRGFEAGPSSTRTNERHHWCESDFTEIQAIALLPRTGPSGRTESEKRVCGPQLGARCDIAMISAMRDAPLQGSEAVALTWGDVEFVQDGSARLTIRPAVPWSASEAAILSVGRSAAHGVR